MLYFNSERIGAFVLSPGLIVMLLTLVMVQLVVMWGQRKVKGYRPTTKQLHELVVFFDDWERNHPLVPRCIDGKVVLFFALSRNDIFKICHGCDYYATKKALKAFLRNRIV